MKIRWNRAMNNSHHEIIKKINDLIKQNDKFIIFNHINPDGDAIGSQLALFIALKNAGKNVYMFSAERIADEYAFLPCSEKIETVLHGDFESSIAIVVDSANAERLSKDVSIDIKKFKAIINIDHHISNTKYGTINWIVPETSSAGELVYLLIKESVREINKEIATCLYTAIFSDTGGFRHGNTTSEALRYAAELVSAGADPHYIARKVYGSYKKDRFLLLGKSLQTLKTFFDGRLATMWVYKNFHDELGTTLADADEFVEYPRGIKGVEISCLFKEIELNSMVRANLRSNNHEYNVNKIAVKFGGGGHTEAAAFNIGGTREEIEQKVVKAICDELSLMNE